jgi:NADH-quinone oxidoreductase subunit N
MFLTPDIINKLQETLVRDCLAFLPELLLCGTLIGLLLLRLFRAYSRRHLGWITLGLTLVTLGVSWAQWTEAWPWLPVPGLLTPTERNLFTGLLVYDNFTIFLRLFLVGTTALLIWLSLVTGIPDPDDSGDFYCLLLGATVGMSLMASANHLLMVFIGVEMASLPSYALAGFLKGQRQSSEASLKFVVYGGGASAIMLYGISLLTGMFGTGYLPDVAYAFAAATKGEFDASMLALLLGLLLILVGVAFKLAAVPFHFWCPDVFEGAAAEVAAFLSVASKGAALALLGRFALVLIGEARFLDNVGLSQQLGLALVFFSALTATFGNLAAYLQTNLKRLLAYSTIAHAGYMMMGLAALNADGAGAVLIYLVAYLFMNLGAFAVVAFLRNQIRSEDLADYRGLVRSAPLLTITLAVFLLSLLGIPPLAGFAAKFQIFRVLFDAGQAYSADPAQAGLGYALYALLVIGGLNTVVSAVYYVKVLKVMILDLPPEEEAGRAPEPLPPPPGAGLYAALLAAVIVVVGIYWDPLAAASARGVRQFQFKAGLVQAARAAQPGGGQP